MRKVRDARRRFEKVSKVHLKRNWKSAPKQHEDVDQTPLLPQLKFRIKRGTQKQHMASSQNVKNLVKKGKRNLMAFKISKCAQLGLNKHTQS